MPQDMGVPVGVIERDAQTHAETHDPHDSPGEVAINATVDATPVLLDTVTMAPAVLWAFCVDVAQNIVDYDVLALRYGFDSWQSMQAWIIANAAVRKKIKELRIIWQSDDNVAVRARTLAGHAVLEAIPYTARPLFDEKTTNADRLDTLKMHARIAGIDGNPHTGRENAGGTGGNPGIGRFSVNIVFPNAGRMESITTIDHERPHERSRERVTEGMEE